MRFVFAARLAEVAAARDGGRLGEGDLLWQALIWLDFRVPSRARLCEPSENRSNFYVISIVRQSLVR